MSRQHLFTTRQGRLLRSAVILRDGYQCQMCGVLVVEGKTSRRSAVVDHTVPVSLAPELERDPDNMRTVCRRCHAVCDSIEKRAQGNAQRIQREKLSFRPVGLDGYPVAR